MSFVDGRVIRQRMAEKDARMAKKLAKTHGKMAVKQTGRHEASPSCPAASTASPQSTDEVPMTPKPDPSTTPPVRTDNRVDPAFLVKADRNSGHIYAHSRNCYWLVSCATAKRDPVCQSCAGKAVRS